MLALSGHLDRTLPSVVTPARARQVATHHACELKADVATRWQYHGLVRRVLCCQFLRSRRGHASCRPCRHRRGRGGTFTTARQCLLGRLPVPRHKISLEHVFYLTAA